MNRPSGVNHDHDRVAPVESTSADTTLGYTEPSRQPRWGGETLFTSRRFGHWFRILTQLRVDEAVHTNSVSRASVEFRLITDVYPAGSVSAVVCE